MASKLPERTKAFFTKSFSASFTIEASVILPISFVIIVGFITTAFSIHDKVIDYSAAIYAVIENAPDGIPDGISDDEAAYVELINTDNMDGRRTLLKYKSLKEGVHSLTGGLDENED